jgi:hypothetical protein
MRTFLKRKDMRTFLKRKDMRTFLKRKNIEFSKIPYAVFLFCFTNIIFFVSVVFITLISPIVFIYYIATEIQILRKLRRQQTTR